MARRTGYEKDWETAYGKDRDPVRMHLIYPLLAEDLQSTNPGRVLDAGCGNGGTLEWACPYFKEAIGVDLSPDFLRTAESTVHNDKIRFINADLTVHVPVPDGWADCILSIFVLNEIRDIDAAFSEMRRLLSAKGTLLAVVTHPFQVLYQTIADPHPAKFSGVLDYFSTSELTYHFTLSEATAVYYHHSFEQILNSLSSSGLALDHMWELTTNAKPFRQYPSYWAQKEHPLFLALRLRAKS